MIMENKKILDGTELGSKSDTATKQSSAPDTAATGFVTLDDDELTAVAGGDGSYVCAYCGARFTSLVGYYFHVCG